MTSNPNPISDHLDLWTSALLNKSTAGRGNNGKQEACGIKKLRELILELAARGKLVPQDLNDELILFSPHPTLSLRRGLLEQLTYA